MIDRKELKICKQRGHKTAGMSDEGWAQCQWCRVWLRTVTTIEEREDEPPSDEQSPFEFLQKRLDKKKAK